MKIRNTATGSITEVRDDPPEGWLIPFGWEVFDGNAEQQTTIEPVPEIIPMWAFRRSLRKRGMLDGILSFISSLPEQQKLDAMEHLEYGNYIERNHPMIVNCSKQLGINDSTVDDIFRDGGKER